MSAVAYVAVLPGCDICPLDSVNRNNPPLPAMYDFKTQDGRWANGCEAHYQAFRLYDTLGTGKGQKLIVGEKPELTAAEKRSAIGDALESGDFDEVEDLIGDGDLSEWL